MWILLELRMVEVVVVTTAAKRSAKQQSNRHHQQTNTQLFTLYNLFVAQPTVLKHLKTKYQIPWICSPQAHLQSSNLVFDHYRLLVTLG